MNEVIKKLAVEAMVEHCVSHVRLKNFSDLILRECVAKVELWEQDSRNHISHMLKEHFGVEE